MHHGEFRDPRLVQVYDAQYGWARDDDFFLSILNATPAARVLDLGCGTGRLAIGLAACGYRVTGVDPARASLDAARAKPGAEAVTWLEGTSEIISGSAFDAALMTSHVAQFFVSDVDWSRALRDLARALVSGGTLAFDTRDPDARAWERWNPAESRRRVVLRDGSTVEVWTEVTRVESGAVTIAHHYGFAEGEELVSTATLRFRSESEVRQSLTEAGFIVQRIFGGWSREPIGAADGELLVIARRRSHE